VQFARVAAQQYGLLSEVMALDIHAGLRDVLRETFRRIGTEFLNPGLAAAGIAGVPAGEGEGEGEGEPSAE
jgi:hypothetical protein